MKQNNSCLLHSPLGYKVKSVVHAEFLGYVRDVIHSQQGVLVVFDESALYFSAEQEAAIGVNWTGKMSWLNLSAKFPPVSLIILSHFNVGMSLNLSTNLSIPVFEMSNLSKDMSSSELYNWLAVYMGQVSKLNVSADSLLNSYISGVSSFSKQFKMSRRAAKMLTRSNYPFVFHEGKKQSRARSLTRPPKP